MLREVQSSLRAKGQQMWKQSRKCGGVLDSCLLGEDVWRAWGDSTAGRDDDEPLEEWDDVHDTERWNSAYPDFSRWVVDDIAGPVSSPRDDHRVSFLSRNSDSRKRMPLGQRAPRDTDEGSGGWRDVLEAHL